MTNTTPTLLTELMRQADSTKALVLENSKTILKSTAKKVLKENLQMEDQDMEETQPTEDPTGYAEVEVDDNGADLPMDTTTEDPGATDAIEAPETETGEEMEAIESPDGEEDVDMTDNSYDEVMEAIRNAPDDVEIVVVKKPTFEIEVGGSAEDDDTDTEEEGEDEELPMESEEEDGALITENKVLAAKNKQLALYESKIKELKGALGMMLKENKAMKANENKYAAAIKETHKLLEGVQLTNVNLMHITRLLTENATTQAEKDEILTEFENKVTTPGESKILFESWNRLLSTTEKTKAPVIDKQKLNETVTVITPKKNIIKESKSYNDDSVFNRIAKYQI